jgi:hypothetical protein
MKDLIVNPLSDGGLMSSLGESAPVSKAARGEKGGYYWVADLKIVNAASS